jgi:hypothetical protein
MLINKDFTEVKAIQEEYSSSKTNGLLPISSRTLLKEYVENCDMYVLGVPNTEVRIGLLKNLIPLCSSMDADKTHS